MALFDKIVKLSKQLYPTGRAWKMPPLGDFEKLTRALAASEARAYADAFTVLNVVLPDNDNFTLADAQVWYRRLGLIFGSGTSLEDAKAAIIRKMNYPGTIKPRQNYRYIQAALQAANFSVYVYENRFPSGGTYVTQSPFDVIPGGQRIGRQLGNFQLGRFQLGGGFANIVANQLEESEAYTFSIGGNLRNTFFISGAVLGTPANVETVRKKEFRELILKLKPAQTVAFLDINYI